MKTLSWIPAVIFGVALSGVSNAGPYDGQPKILLHVGSPTGKNQCEAGTLGDCQSAVTAGAVVAGDGPYYYVYLTVAKGDLSGVMGFTCGIDYEGGKTDGESDRSGIDIFEWQGCGGLISSAGDRSGLGPAAIS